MSVAAGISDPEKVYKKLFHRRNDSGELDVFEATRYFAGATEVPGYRTGGTAFTHKMIMSEEKLRTWRGGRVSLDMPLRKAVDSQIHAAGEKQMIKEKKTKQPRSPGGKLASFLNSLFSQTASKKKKSKSTTQSVKDEDESPGGRRRRRSSISHFRSSSTADSKSIYSLSSSGFRTPPPFAEVRKLVSYSKFNALANAKPAINDDKRRMDYPALDAKLKNFDNGFSEKKCSRKFEEVDDGGESDSSSDLFELENYDLGYCSSDPPVYETTRLDSIKMAAPISNGAF
ncbi:protein BIG GRAIN 1-like E [Diospyros lotus]|uniref:protein BIG GRAIN 1-like E n=1 Tax=Diospyros lotus TaxID=55363 RepID=UPI00224CE5D0|nr:protein BIG GRAIN 1-like E [Diospyros lotus]